LVILPIKDEYQHRSLECAEIDARSHAAVWRQNMPLGVCLRQEALDRTGIDDLEYDSCNGARPCAIFRLYMWMRTNVQGGHTRSPAFVSLQDLSASLLFCFLMLFLLNLCGWLSRNGRFMPRPRAQRLCRSLPSAENICVHKYEVCDGGV